MILSLDVKIPKIFFPKQLKFKIKLESANLINPNYASSCFSPGVQKIQFQCLRLITQVGLTALAL